MRPRARRLPRLSRRSVLACASALGLALLLALLATRFGRPPSPLRPTPPAAPLVAAGTDARISPELAARLAAIEAGEQHLASTLWARDILAQRCGRTLESLWNSVNAASNKLQTLAAFHADSWIPPRWHPPRPLPHQIQLHEPGPPPPPLSPADWRALIQPALDHGWRLDHLELRHRRFETGPSGLPLQSTFLVAAELTLPARDTRAVLEGTVLLHWTAPSPDSDRIPVSRVDASRLTLRTRQGAPPFALVLNASIAPPENAHSVDPLILQDLDGDGLSEILLAGRNLAYWNLGDARFESRSLCRLDPGLISTAVVADFDGDGFPDLLGARHEGLALRRGSAAGSFDTPPQPVWPAPADLQYPMVLTCGDVDLDGDLDVFLAQYKVPYEAGAMPTPFHDANDGYPAYLLLNEGQGRFADGTGPAGLTAKRHRRTYSASLADLNRDGHLDLVVVSDFAGVDVHRNDGRGRFTDVTRAWIPEPHAFGMAHALADFNRDGRLDLLMMGMTSPTASRLDHAGLRHPGSREDPSLRARMTHGNRLYLARPEGGFLESDLGQSIADSGWSWGCSAFDLDNDGFPEVHVANGLESRNSVQDYEAEYWLHDLHLGTSEPDPAVYLHFMGKFNRTRGRGQSYGGYERNRLFLNLAGRSFLDAAHLLGVGSQRDARNVVADDLDGDGRVDLVVTSFEEWPQARLTVQAFRNTLDTAHAWIGFRFPSLPGGRSPMGATVELEWLDGTTPARATRTLATGDSYRSQHAATLHFGIGQAATVERATVRWPGGHESVLSNLPPNRCHPIRTPSRPLPSDAGRDPR